LAIDLPLKAVAWERKRGRVFLSFNSPEVFKTASWARRGAVRGCRGLIDKALE
jgi:uncharacterized protein (DUF302 family)